MSLKACKSIKLNAICMRASEMETETKRGEVAENKKEAQAEAD